MNNKVASNFIWRFLERCGAQSVSLVVSLILARLLNPQVYGTIALVTVITSVLQVFIDSGLGNALVQKKDADSIDFSSVFYFNLFISIALYVGMFIAAPFISRFYGKYELTTLVRVLSLSLVISGIKNVQEAYVARNLLFKKFFFATLAGTIGAAIVGIWMAFNGYGVWALVAQNLFNLTVDTLVLWLTVKWRPVRAFSLIRLKGLLSFGWKLLASRIISSVYLNIRQLLIGKLYSSEDLAFYNRGYEFPAKIVPNVVTAINSVLLPTMAAKQDKKDAIVAITKRASKISSFIIWPAMMGLAACGESLILLLLTEKWLPALPFLVVFCFDYALWPVIYTYNNAINAIGRSDIYLTIQVLQKTMGILVLMMSLKKGVLAIAICVPFISIVELLLSSMAMGKLFGYHLKEQFKEICPIIVLAVSMGIIVYAIKLLNMNAMVTILLQIITGVTIYIGAAKLLGWDELRYIEDFVKTFRAKE